MSKTKHVTKTNLNFIYICGQSQKQLKTQSVSKTKTDDNYNRLNIKWQQNQLKIITKTNADESFYTLKLKKYYEYFKLFFRKVITTLQQCEIRYSFQIKFLIKYTNVL